MPKRVRVELDILEAWLIGMPPFFSLANARLMKHSYLLTLFLILVISSAVHAQRKSWAVGFQIGENFSTLTGENAYDYRPGISGGFHLSHYLLNDLVIRLEVNIDDRGTQLNPSLNADPFGANEYRLTYLSLPILLRYSTETRVKFIAGGGMSVDFLLAEQVGFDSPGAMGSPRFRPFNTDLIGCVGGAYPINERLSLSAEARSVFALQTADRPDGVASRLGRFFSWEILFGLNYYL